MDTQICLLTTLLYLDMWAMVMLAPAPRPPPCRVTSCSPPHILSHTQTQCVYNIYRSARSVRPDQLVLAQSQALAQILPTQLHNLNVCVCVCAPCVCSVNRPVPSLLSCLGGFVSCHAHVTRPSSRAKPSQAKSPSGQVSKWQFIFYVSVFVFLIFFALSLLRCLIKFQFQAGGSGSVCCKLSKLGNELGNWSDPIGCPPSLYVCTWSWGLSLPPTWERTPQRVRLTHKEPCHSGRGESDWT